MKNNYEISLTKKYLEDKINTVMNDLKLDREEAKKLLRKNNYEISVTKKYLEDKIDRVMSIGLGLKREAAKQLLRKNDYDANKAINTYLGLTLIQKKKLKISSILNINHKIAENILNKNNNNIFNSIKNYN